MANTRRGSDNFPYRVCKKLPAGSFLFPNNSKLSGRVHPYGDRGGARRRGRPKKGT